MVWVLLILAAGGFAGALWCFTTARRDIALCLLLAAFALAAILWAEAIVGF
ncbi:MAG TPA: hypothetical protein VGG10_11765 [Rhizomicrobium sp.]